MNLFASVVFSTLLFLQPQVPAVHNKIETPFQVNAVIEDSDCLHDKYGYWVIEPDDAIGFSQYTCEDALINGYHTPPPITLKTYFGVFPLGQTQI